MIGINITFNSLTDSHGKLVYSSFVTGGMDFQFPNGFSQNIRSISGEEEKYCNFQFPNGFSLIAAGNDPKHSSTALSIP